MNLGTATAATTTWRDYCKHYGPCATRGANDRCFVADDPSYIADMIRKDAS